MCTHKKGKTFADHWKFVGIAVEEPGYTIWGTSPIIGDDGKTHLFVSRWPGTTVEPVWRTDSEIAHYVGDSPEGPFVFLDVALTGTGKDTWDKVSVHNPTIHYGPKNSTYAKNRTSAGFADKWGTKANNCITG